MSPTKFVEYFVCLTCQDRTEFQSHGEFINHAKNRHGLAEGERIPGELVLHLDQQDAWETHDKFRSKKLTFLRVTRGPRQTKW
jgi:hypothetical protein